MTMISSILDIIQNSTYGDETDAIFRSDMIKTISMGLFPHATTHLEHPRSVSPSELAKIAFIIWRSDLADDMKEIIILHIKSNLPYGNTFHTRNNNLSDNILHRFELASKFDCFVDLATMVANLSSVSLELHNWFAYCFNGNDGGYRFWFDDQESMTLFRIAIS